MHTIELFRFQNTRESKQLIPQPKQIKICDQHVTLITSSKLISRYIKFNNTLWNS